MILGRGSGGPATYAYAVGWVQKMGPVEMSWSLPVVVDALALVAGAVWLSPRMGMEARDLARGVTLAAVLGSVGLNALGHLVESGDIKVDPVMRIGVSTVPPLVAAVVVHLVGVVLTTRPAPAAARQLELDVEHQEEKAGPAPHPAPAPVELAKPEPRPEAAVTPTPRPADVAPPAAVTEPIAPSGARPGARPLRHPAGAARAPQAVPVAGRGAGARPGPCHRPSRPPGVGGPGAAACAAPALRPAVVGLVRDWELPGECVPGRAPELLTDEQSRARIRYGLAQEWTQRRIGEFAGRSATTVNKVKAAVGR
ncbi:DUF2637 domain-containing protein [Streptomyces niveus]|uniref:DUF2637 domain-containing protein n=1 Tax=Streptomyces niveus TaxID=193462 RepID=UPI003413CCB0